MAKKFNVPSDVSVEDFFAKFVPEQFGEMMSGVDLSSLSGKDITLEFNVNDKRYCIKIKDGKLDVIKGGVDSPILSMGISEKVFLDAITGKIDGFIDRFTDPSELADPKRLSALMDTKGSVNMTLKRSDGDIPVTMTFNGVKSPEVNINIDLQDWISMQNKETTGMNLFMGGKLKFTGDMMLLMKLQNLM